jgi:hypothetical protein
MRREHVTGDGSSTIRDVARTFRALIVIALAVGCTATAASQAPRTPSSDVQAAYGEVPGQRTFDPKVADHFIREPEFPRGMFAVPLERDRLLAFDAESTQSGICTRVDPQSFMLPNGNVQYYRFRCEGEWTSRAVVFITDTALRPTRAESLKWTRIADDPPLARSGTTPPDLHGSVASASPKLLNGQLLVRAAWFRGTFPPLKEPDELRGDTIAFGHYMLQERTLFIGRSARTPGTVLYRATDPTEVREGLEWALLPETASEKTRADIAAIYEMPKGYLLRVNQEHDHEGFGTDDAQFFYAYQSGAWRFVAKAEQTILY